jgi:small subunit ribosomal protein S16
MTVEVDEERARYWLGVGAQPTEAVARLLHKKGILESFEYSHRKGSKDRKAASEEAEAEVTTEEASGEDAEVPSEEAVEVEEAAAPEDEAPEEASEPPPAEEPAE